ncbi:mechanosensitive ion channel family protein [Halodesulfovibrio marinisediminis]|nr:mechanosensitive ion channel family protein [Halodesulfovibrio marinisediminis]
MALETKSCPAPNPLCPPDTSSPRATLNSFLANVTIAIDGWRKKSNSPRTYQAFRRAVDTLDFSTTPKDSTTVVQIERIIMLKEILDRISLPPDDKIPDAAEVRATYLTTWTIPDTKIKIVRIANGPRRGEFLFSPETVQNLKQYYKRIKQEPYKTNSTAGIYNEIINGKHTAYSFERQARFRLRPVDTSSPRSTLEGFLDSVNRAFAIITKVNQSHSTMTKAKILEAQQAADDLFERAIDTLDLHDVPVAHREDVGIESVLLLKEIIDRLPLPQIDFVPDAAMVTAQLASQKEIHGKSYQYHWRFPNTEIEIVEIKEGERQGQFLFSAETVRRLRHFYQQIKDHPYRPDYLTAASPEEYIPPEKTEGFYNHYISTPGVLVPQAHLLSTLINNFPDSLKKAYGKHPLWQWLALAFSIAFILLTTYMAFRFIWVPAKSQKRPLRDWLRLLLPLVIISATYIGVYFLTKEANLTGDLLVTVVTGGKVLLILVSAWAAFSFCNAAAETITTSPLMAKEGFNATILKLTSRVLGAVAAGVIIVKGGQRLGLDMLPLLAGFGVGGLAVALAAKHTFANIIGCLTLLFNKPIKVGDLCRYNGKQCTVEHIGLISTRIRSSERTIITVPNADLAQMALENLQLRDKRLFNTVIQLRDETTPEQMRWILIKLRELLLGHPKVTPNPARVRFIGYGDFSKDIEIFAYLNCQDQNTFLAIQEDIFLRIEDIISESGSSTAFPSQTIYTSRDNEVNLEQCQHIESEVQKWRSKGQLPFPDFSEERREELLDKLEYPPKGSQSEKPLSGPSNPLKNKPKK